MKGLKLYCRWYIFIILYQCCQATDYEFCYLLTKFQMNDEIDNSTLNNSTPHEMCKKKNSEEYFIRAYRSEQSIFEFQQSEIKFEVMDSTFARFIVTKGSSQTKFDCVFAWLNNIQNLHLKIYPPSSIDLSTDTQFTYSIADIYTFNDTEDPNDRPEPEYWIDDIYLFVRGKKGGEKNGIKKTYTFRKAKTEEPYLFFLSKEFYNTGESFHQIMLYLKIKPEKKYILRFHQPWGAQQFRQYVTGDSSGGYFVHNQPWLNVLKNRATAFGYFD